MTIKISPQSIAMTLVAGFAACALMSSANAFNPQPDPPGKPEIGASKMHNPPDDKTDKSRKAKSAKSGVVGPNDKSGVVGPNDKGAVIDPNDKGAVIDPNVKGGVIDPNDKKKSSGY